MKGYDLGTVVLFAVKGPDALRYLNGQITQDVRKVIGTETSLPACLLDVKGRVQFRVRVMDDGAGNSLVEGNVTRAEELEARLGKYLIADDAEVGSLGEHRLLHFTGNVKFPDAICRASNRFEIAGTDCLFPAGKGVFPPEDMAMASAEETEDQRIRCGMPSEEKELADPVFPQEAGLEDSDISFHKGCYIGQEVISRIKRAGKVNRKLTRLLIPETGFEEGSELTDPEGKTVGHITSISPIVTNGKRFALAYLKRDAAVAGDFLPANQ